MRDGINLSAKYSLACSIDGVGPTEEWRQLQDTIKDCIRGIVAAVRRGAFPVVSRDDQCTSYCSFATVCRIAQVRSLDKAWTSTDALTPDT